MRKANDKQKKPVQLAFANGTGHGFLRLVQKTDALQKSSRK